MSPRYIRRLGLVSCGALLLGAIGLVLYFQFIAGQPGQNLGIIGLLNVPSLIFFSIGFRYICAGLQHWLDQLHAGAPAIDVPVAIRRRVLGLVPRLTMLSAAAWLLAAVGPLATSAWGPGGLGRAVVVALGLVGVGGVLTPAIIYFAADLAWRPAIHAFFPDGRLSAVSSESRPILPRLLVAFLLASVWLPALLVISSLSHTAGLIGRRYTEGTFHHLLLIELILLAACVVVSLTLAILVTRGITDPVRALQRAMARVERNDLNTEVAVTTDDEIGYLGERFNQMAAGLRERERIRRVFGQYVTTQVAEAALRGEVKVGGERTEVTVLMTDLRDFTTLCESMEPEAVVTLLNRYFDAMIDAVLEYGGTLDKFVGDAVITVFNAPLPHEDHPLRAVLTALSMRERLAAFNAEQQREDQPVLRMGIGIHTGQAIVGNVGSEGKRVEYTAMGDTVNVAARLEGLTKELGCDICLSAETFRRVRDWVLVEDPLSTRVKGRRAPVTVYGLIGMRPGVGSAGSATAGMPDVVQRAAT